MILASISPPPPSRSNRSRGGRKHTRRLKNNWRRAAEGNTQARTWLVAHNYQTPNLGGHKRSALVDWSRLPGARTLSNYCPSCWSYGESGRVNTTVGFRLVFTCTECRVVYKPY